MPHYERYELVLGFKNVSEVYSVDDSDGTVCEALKRIKPNYFGNGGIIKIENTPEAKVCEELGIELVFNLGGGKVYNSGDIVNSYVKEELTQEKKNL
jgi:D-beta-D-heptose 7-phosphate kinase/D-beta-D-heptose 1-phosphate adenosyltransferase